MPLSFLYYHVAEQWQLVQQKMIATGKNYTGCSRITFAFKMKKMQPYHFGRLLS